MKALFRFLFSAHVIALVFLAIAVYRIMTLTGSTLPALPFALEDALLVSAVFAMFVLFGYAAGVEARGFQVRALRRALEIEADQHASMRHLNSTLVDDVLLAARHGLPVKSFPYGGPGVLSEIDRVAREHERARDQAAFDLSGRL